jgi:hypothetical protein
LRPLRRTAAATVVALGIALAAACAAPPPAPESMRDPDADFAAYRTYGWAPAGGVSDADAPLQLLDRNIREAIAEQMKRRGYVESQQSPDLRIAYETASADKVENSPVRVGVGVGSWGGNFGGSVNVGSPSVRNYREGTLVIHAIDADRNAEVWQGRVSGRISNGSLEPAAIATAVSTAMRDFPAHDAP